ncbi:MAG: 50S ribosomal protein L3 [Patescibacteria group bacterium]|nr:50S ribosomal protein L3 [Patescibacteria group bacterium]
MKFILGKKINMTQIFDDEGRAHSSTIVETEPLTVSQLKTKEKDGYSAVQVIFGAKKIKKEFRDIDDKAYFVDEKIEPTLFKVGDSVTVSAISKGKGFQGVVKRHGFHGGPRSHGQKHSEREPGSIGGGLRNKVPKNMRMAGRMGSDRITVKNLKIVHIDEATNSFYIEGAIPGKRGTLVEIRAK